MKPMIFVLGKECKYYRGLNRALVFLRQPYNRAEMIEIRFKIDVIADQTHTTIGQ
jgi:hypothetical protein